MAESKLVMFQYKLHGFICQVLGSHRLQKASHLKMTSKLIKLGCSRPKLDPSFPKVGTNVLNLENTLSELGTHPLEVSLTKLEPWSQKMVAYQSKLEATLPRFSITNQPPMATKPTSLSVKDQTQFVDNLGRQQVGKPRKVMTHTTTT